MEFVSSVNWIFCLATAVILLLFVFISYISVRMNWTLVILISLVLGGAVGILFSSEGNSYLKAAELISDVYVNVITLLAVPVILVSIISSFISLQNHDKLKKIGLRSIAWLIISAVLAIVLSILVGCALGIGSSAAPVFQAIGEVSDSSVSAYSGLQRSFYDVLLGLFPSNIVNDIADNNIVAVIMIAAAVAVAYIGIAKEEGEEQLSVFRDFINALKKIIYKILEYVIDLTPYAVLCLIAGSASSIFTNRDAIVQLLLLVVVIYAVCLLHTFVINGVLLRLAARLDPVRFFKKVSPAQAMAFTTQSSVGSLPINISCLETKVGVDEEIANFTAALGTTIGMPGCTGVWPTLLAIFFANATGLSWKLSDYVVLAVMATFLSFGSAGVPGIAVVSAIALFSMLDLPIAAVILLMPINTISDMIRTTDNVTSAAVATAIVARQEGLLHDEIFNQTEAAGETL